MKAGAGFVVAWEDDVVILKAITMLHIEGFDTLIRKARQQWRSGCVDVAIWIE